MQGHPIQNLMSTTMENIKDMVDVNTVVGDPVQTTDGMTIIPISRVSFGFVAGGGEYSVDEKQSRSSGSNAEELPFAGGSGAGVSVQPMGFLVVGQGQVKMLPTNYSTPVDRVMELLPQVLGEVKNVLGGTDEVEEGARHAKSSSVVHAQTVASPAKTSSVSPITNE